MEIVKRDDQMLPVASVNYEKKTWILLKKLIGVLDVLLRNSR